MDRDGRSVRQGRGVVVLPGDERSGYDRALTEGPIPVSSTSQRVLSYTQRDVIDNHVSIPAQHSLVRLSSKNPATRGDAVGLLEEVKAEGLAGIYCANWHVAVRRALKLGTSCTSWWTAIPEEEDAVLLLDAAHPTDGRPPSWVPTAVTSKARRRSALRPSDSMRRS